MSLQPMRTPPFVGGTQIDPVTGLPVTGVMGFPMLPPASATTSSRVTPGKVIGGLLGAPNTYGGLLSEQDANAARTRALMTMGASLLSNSGPSPVKRGLGELAGQAILAGQGAKDQYEQQALQTLLLKSQIEKSKQKDKGKLVAALDPVTNKPVYRYEADAEGMAPYEKPGQMAAPVAIRDKDGTTKYVTREEALGREPYSQPQTQVNVSTDRSLYGTLAEKQAAQYSDLYSQAQTAPERIARSQRVKALLDQGAYTGTAANFKLAFGKAARELGYDFGDEIQNTEALASDLAGATLEAIRSSGLGGGNGFSNADRDFLERVTGGKITLEANTLRRLADLNERAARLTVKRWNSTARRLKPEMLDQLGMGVVEEGGGNNMGNGWSIEPVR